MWSYMHNKTNAKEKNIDFIITYKQKFWLGLQNSYDSINKPFYENLAL